MCVLSVVLVCVACVCVATIGIIALLVFKEDDTTLCSQPAFVCAPYASCDAFCLAGFKAAKESCWGAGVQGVCATTCAVPTPPFIGDVTFWNEAKVEGQLYDDTSLGFEYLLWAVFGVGVCSMAIQLLGEWLSVRMRLNITRYFHQHILEDKLLYELTVRSKVRVVAVLTC
jgi:hypothetical protein